MTTTPDDTTYTCPICGSMDIDLFIEIEGIPVLCNVLGDTRAAALSVPRGDLRLGFCEQCGHIYNYAFDPSLIEYDMAYENSLHFSPRFRAYADGLAEHLVERYDLHGKDVIDIGCGKGDFLELLCEKGVRQGIGFDPSYDPELTENGTGHDVTVIRDYYSEAYTDYHADLVTCRHVLEHVPDPTAFLRSVRHTVGDRAETGVFFEVPNVRATLHDLAIWDLIYEHCSYFSAASLEYLFAHSGFVVQDVVDAYDGQYLCIEALPLHGDSGRALRGDAGREALRRDVRRFARRYDDKVTTWREALRDMETRDEHAVIWGAGSKGNILFNILGEQDRIRYAVDINPRKQGKYVAGTGHKIVPPAFLRELQPDVIVIMNGIYEDEIRQTVRDLGIDATFWVA
ncbi:MAG: methyltransferase domain-containing protein [Bacteroidetes bacterium]|jgi:SAM-dependent methyltransferase|nr:methyltransferase domain-containing protein [Bacteroidota bacterium]